MAAGKSVVPGSPNEGQTDLGRGSSVVFPYTKAGRNTGRVTGPQVVPNPVDEAGRTRVANDPRLVK